MKIRDKWGYIEQDKLQYTCRIIPSIMIEESDVRIGNLVWYYDYNLVETIFRVEGVLNGFIYNSGLPKNKLPFEKVNPVTLEVDHLLRFGFLAGEKEYGEDPDTYAYKYDRTKSVYIRDLAGTFQPLTDSPSGLVPYGRPLAHLHQMQNLFYDLTREDVFTG